MIKRWKSDLNKVFVTNNTVATNRAVTILENLNKIIKKYYYNNLLEIYTQTCMLLKISTYHQKIYHKVTFKTL